MSLIYRMSNSKYSCLKCNFFTSNLKDYNRHLNTQKHKNSEKKYICECGKEYKYRGSLHNHKKKCKFNGIEKEISDLKNIVLDMIPKMNNKISINVFLNEHCKDAVDFNDFLSRIKISFDDLLRTNELGYSKGISNIFMNELKQLEKSERPIHCTDIKRKQFYIKEKQQWNLDNGDCVVKAIDTITNKQIQQINKWEIYNKNWKENNKKLDEFITLTNNITGGITNKEKEKNVKDTLKLIGMNTSIKNVLT